MKTYKINFSITEKLFEELKAEFSIKKFIGTFDTTNGSDFLMAAILAIAMDRNKKGTLLKSKGE